MPSMREVAKELEGECRAVMRRLGAQAQWSGFRSWMAAQAMLPQAGIAPLDIVSLWVEETIAEEEWSGDKALLIQMAAEGWLPALRKDGLSGFRLVAKTPGLLPVDEARLRLGEVAGLLDGLLNRSADPPDDARFREEVARLEAIEELLDGIAIEDGPAGRAAGLVIGNLTAAIEDGIMRLADICRAIVRAEPR